MDPYSIYACSSTQADAHEMDVQGHDLKVKAILSEISDYTKLALRFVSA